VKTNFENRSFSLRYFTLTFRKKNRDAAAIAFHVVFFLLLQGAFKDVFSNNPLFVSMIRVFFCNLFCFKLIYGFAIYKLITSKTKKQTNLNEKKNRRNKNYKPIYTVG